IRSKDLRTYGRGKVKGVHFSIPKKTRQASGWGSYEELEQKSGQGVGHRRRLDRRRWGHDQEPPVVV
ncbi:hypothetical protein RUND412_004921, partial [Rhizina undulata]